MGAPNGPRLGLLDVDVDPLVVAGGFGELVDPLLGDGDPVADGDFLPDQGRQGTYVLAAHPNWRESRVNRRLLETARGRRGRARAGPVRRLPRLRHRRRRRTGGRWRRPAWWCCCTRSSGTRCRPLMKLWLDDVLTHGWAYGPAARRCAARTCGWWPPPAAPRPRTTRRATTATSSTPSCRRTSRPRRCAACASCRRCCSTARTARRAGDRRARRRLRRPPAHLPGLARIDDLPRLPGLRRAGIRPAGRRRPGGAA
jgi:hypothetical protein